MVKLDCLKCSHKWEYKGTSRFVICPHCRSTVKNIYFVWGTPVKKECVPNDADCGYCKDVKTCEKVE